VGLNCLRGKRYGLEARAADFVDGHRRDVVGQAALQPRLARGVLPQARRDHVAHDDFIYLASLYT